MQHRAAGKFGKRKQKRKSEKRQQKEQYYFAAGTFEREYFCQQRRHDFYHYAKPAEENEAVQMGVRLAKELGVVLPISFYEKEVNNL